MKSKSTEDATLVGGNKPYADVSKERQYGPSRSGRYVLSKRQHVKSPATEHGIPEVTQSLTSALGGGSPT